MGAARYPKEFKGNAVALVLFSGRSVGSVTKELGGNIESLRQWVRRARPATIGGDGDAVTPVEREGLKRLPRHELEKEILRNGAHVRISEIPLIGSKLAGSFRSILCQPDGLYVDKGGEGDDQCSRQTPIRCRAGAGATGTPPISTRP
ncbi:transposase [Streptomyces prunicolor]|uniref:transposase n=1 Tax=Streptomyces prunicolor TaxID=67348 RepID=UPI001319D17B|nr:transposase [Streptomyces prunicolor]